MPDDAPGADEDPLGESETPSEPEAPPFYPPPGQVPPGYPPPGYPPPGQVPPGYPPGYPPPGRVPPGHPPGYPPPGYPPPGYPPPGYPPPGYPPPGQVPPGYPPPGYPPPPDRPPGGAPNDPSPGALTPAGRVGATGPTDSLGRPLSTWAKRAMAFVLDLAVAGVAGAVVVAVAMGNRITESSGGSTTIHLKPGDTFLLLALFFLTYTAYFSFLTGSRRGRTLGAMAVGIAVRDATGGGQIGAARGLVRSLIICAFCIPYLLIPWAFDMLTPLWSPTRQALHDKAAHSVVVDVR